MHLVLKPEQMKALEKSWTFKGFDEKLLMENAAHAVVQYISHLKPKTDVWVLCGPGNNGADGLCISRLLSLRGYSVRTLCIQKKESIQSGKKSRQMKVSSSLVDWAKRIFEHVGLECEEVLTAKDLKRLEIQVRKHTVFIDALFGSGLNRKLSGTYMQAVKWLNQQAKRKHGIVVSVDIPSGIDGHSGFALGDVFVNAHSTIALGAYTRGHFQNDGIAASGQLILGDLGVPFSEQEDEFLPSVLDPRGIGRRDHRWLKRIHAKRVAKLQAPKKDVALKHKYDFGHLLAIVGGKQTPGAGILAAKGAFRTGVGLISILHHTHWPESLIQSLPELMLAPEKDLDRLKELKLSAVLIGSGLLKVTHVKQYMLKAIEADIPLLMDAECFSYLKDSKLRTSLQKRSIPAVLTPHEGEFKKAFSDLVKPSMDRIDKALAVSKQLNVVVVLKGPYTIISHPHGRAFVAPFSDPQLATAGSGDVLAGIIAGLLAQNYDPLEAAIQGVCTHGLAAQKYSQASKRKSMSASDLLDTLRCLPGVLS